MIKLTAKNDWQKATWYFHNMKDCEKFKKEFLDHGASINWNEPIEADSFSGMTSDDYIAMDEKPKKRAEDDLCWAFNSYIPDNKGCDISRQLAKNFMERMGI